MFGLVDCNNFYASCERVFQPRLKGLPIVVLSNNDGCVIARSNESKALGIPMGAPAFEIKDIVEKHGVNVFSSNYTLYNDLSCRVMDTLSGLCPLVEIYSIDEAFIGFHGMELYDLEKFSRDVRDKVIKYTKIPVSVGVAATKTLAKMANKFAKKSPEWGGVCVLGSEKKKIGIASAIPDRGCVGDWASICEEIGGNGG